MRGFSLLGEFIIGGSTVFRNVGVVSQHALTAVGCVIVTSWTFCTCLKIVKAIRSGILVIVSCIPRIPHLLSECVSVTGEWGYSACISPKSSNKCVCYVNEAVKAWLVHNALYSGISLI